MHTATIRVVFLALTTAVLLGLPLHAEPIESSDEAPIEWVETSRDIYVDSVLDDGAWVLTTGDPARLAILPSGWDTAMVLIGDEAIGRLEASRLTPVDGGDARSPAPTPTEGRRTRIATANGTVELIEAGETTIAVASHLGAVGPLDLSELWDWRPTWQARRDAARPDAAVVESLAKIDRPHTVRIYLGTWCGDSRANVPPVLAALEAAANPNLQVELTAIQRGFTEPMSIVRDAHLTNVPTIVVEDASGEVGRLVETPAGDSMAADLAALLTRDPTTHPGALAKVETVVRGLYRKKTADGAPHGQERFTLYRTTQDRWLLHCATSAENDTEIDAWHRFHPDGRTDFIEVTQTRVGAHARTRLWIDEDGVVSATTRGTPSGIVRQTLQVDDPRAAYAPCLASIGSLPARLGFPAESAPAVAVSVGGPTAVYLAPVAASVKIADAVDPHRADRTVTQVESAGVRWWLDQASGLPVSGALADGGTFLLERLEQP